ncbi:MAG: TolC family protein [Bacteroidales bacterium]|nr:TolC family protein [Bacteroidales bacterium]
MKHLLIALALASCGVSPIVAQSVWTYPECVEYARLHNINLQKSRLTEESAKYDLEEAKAQWQPTLDFATNQGYSNYPWGEAVKNSYISNYGLNSSWTVWNGGVRENNIRRQKLQSRINELNTGDVLRTLETDLLQVYINILYAKEAIGIYKEAARLSMAQAERARQLMEAGRLSRVDYAQLKSQYEQDEYAIVNAQGTYDTRRMELKKLLELGIDMEISLKDIEWTAEQILAQLPDMSESYRMAVDTDLRIRSLELEKEGTDIDIAIAKAGRMPKIALNASVGTGYGAPGDPFGTALKKGLNETVGLTLSVPIFDNKKTSSAVARSKVQALNAQLDIEQRYTDIAQTVENWYIDTRSAQSRFVAAQQQLSAAELTDELTNEQFKLGLVNTVELMTSHNDLTQARHVLLQAKYMAMLGQKMIEYYRTATVTLD